MPWLLRFLSELVLIILSYIDVAGWKQIRLPCKSLSKLAASLLFSRIYFELCGRGCKSLYNIFQEPTLAPLVKTIVLRRVRGYRRFGSFNDWAASVYLPGGPDERLWTAAEQAYYDNVLSHQLMPSAKWSAMLAEQKEELYRAYDADRLRQLEQISETAHVLCFRAMHKPEYINPARASISGTANVAIRQFNKALRALTNLSALEHKPGFIYDGERATRWRDLYFNPYSLLDHTNYLDDEDVEALQLSIVLQSLACFRAEDRRLRRMSLYVGGRAFATPERLQHLWVGLGHEITRLYREMYPDSSAAAVDKQAYADDATPAKIELYSRELQLMRLAFAGLTHLEYRVSDED